MSIGRSRWMWGGWGGFRLGPCPRTARVGRRVVGLLVPASVAPFQSRHEGLSGRTRCLRDALPRMGVMPFSADNLMREAQRTTNEATTKEDE